MPTLAKQRSTFTNLYILLKSMYDLLETPQIFDMCEHVKKLGLTDRYRKHMSIASKQGIIQIKRIQPGKFVYSWPNRNIEPNEKMARKIMDTLADERAKYEANRPKKKLTRFDRGRRPGKPLDIQLVRRAERLHSEGMAITDIAKEIGRATSTISRWLSGKIDLANAKTEATVRVYKLRTDSAAKKLMKTKMRNITKEIERLQTDYAALKRTYEIL